MYWPNDEKHKLLAHRKGGIRTFNGDFNIRVNMIMIFKRSLVIITIESNRKYC